MAKETDDKALVSTCLFKLKNETPGALRYEQVDVSGNIFNIGDGALIGTLYLRKSALNGVVPKEFKLDLTITK